MLAARPAKLETVLAKLVARSVNMMKAVRRRENLSRMRAARPLPVTMPIRTVISWTMDSRMAVKVSTHRSS